jgi:hypothetical protein
MTPTMSWSPGDRVPNGYRIRYQYNERKLIVGGSILAGSFTVTTLIASAIGVTGFGFLFAPLGGIPVIGAFPLAAMGTNVGIGPGTVGALIGLGVLQGVGFTILMQGIGSRKTLGLVPRCDEARNEGEHLVVAPLVSPTMAGLSLGGAL